MPDHSPSYKLPVPNNLPHPENREYFVGVAKDTEEYKLLTTHSAHDHYEAGAAMMYQLLAPYLQQRLNEEVDAFLK